MKSETIGVTISYKTPITFHLRIIGIDEENQLRQKMFGIPDSEKAEKAYQNNVDLLAELSEAMPTGMFPNKPAEMKTSEQAQSEITFIEDFSSPAEAVRHYFREKTVIRERTAEYAVRAYFSKLTPEVSFL